MSSIEAHNQKELERFNRALQKMVSFTGQPMEDILKQQGRLAAVELAKVTYRKGKSAKVGAAHKKDVENDIRRLYIDPKRIAQLISRVYGQDAGKRFEKYIRRKDKTKAEQLIQSAQIESKFFKGKRLEVDSWDGGDLHRESKRSRKTRRRIVLMGGKGDLSRYVRKTKSNVGKAKSSFASAAQDLGGTRGIPLYAKKGHKRIGRGKVTGRNSKAVVAITSKAHDYALPFIDLNRAFNYQAIKMERTITRMIDRKSKQTARRV